MPNIRSEDIPVSDLEDCLVSLELSVKAVRSALAILRKLELTEFQMQGMATFQKGIKYVDAGAARTEQIALRLERLAATENVNNPTVDGSDQHTKDEEMAARAEAHAAEALGITKKATPKPKKSPTAKRKKKGA